MPGFNHDRFGNFRHDCFSPGHRTAWQQPSNMDFVFFPFTILRLF
jgi:hypothetical protein